MVYKAFYHLLKVKQNKTKQKLLTESNELYIYHLLMKAIVPPITQRNNLIININKSKTLYDKNMMLT